MHRHIVMPRADDEGMEVHVVRRSYRVGRWMKADEVQDTAPHESPGDMPGIATLHPIWGADEDRRTGARPLAVTHHDGRGAGVIHEYPSETTDEDLNDT